MGNQESRIRYEGVFKACNALFFSLSDYVNEPNDERKLTFADKFKEARQSIQIFLRANNNDAVVANNMRQVLLILSKDLSPIVNYNRNYDELFKERGYEAHKVMQEVMDIVSKNATIVNMSVFDRLKKAVGSFLEWFSPVVAAVLPQRALEYFR